MKNHQYNQIDIEHGHIDLSHGAGGKQMTLLIECLFKKHFNNSWLNQANDQALFNSPADKLVVSTDGFVISPRFFPGGDIGSLAVHGTINDVAMAGATPLYLTAGFILEEGLALKELEQIVISMAQAAKLAGTPIITGDTKVVEHGKGDGVFITTTGIGKVASDINISSERAQSGCAILINGSIGDHGMAVMASREQLHFDPPIYSDAASLHTLVADMVATAGADIFCLRDPTRGGLAAALNELAQQSKVGMVIDEQQIPVKPAVLAACEILGLDPLYIANEGKLICICAAEVADALLAVMRQHPLGQQATQIGQVISDKNNMVQMVTRFGGRRVVDWPVGEQLPRIC